MAAAPCKVEKCSAPTRKNKDGFCTPHYKQFQKGLLTKAGELTELGIKRARKDAMKGWAQTKEDIGKKITPASLKVLQEVYPETTKATWCKLIGFWTCEAVCLSRTFLWPNPPEECSGCHQNDDRLDFFKDFLGREGVR